MAQASGHQLYELGKRPADPRVVASPENLDASVGSEIGQPSSNRITTRGNPPETALVSAALVKPASSKSLRVPT